jgi:hypothetical protein
MDHSGITASCSTCHNGSIAPGKSPTHISSTNTCDDCHRTTNWVPVIKVDHDSVLGSCFTCHNGSTAPGKPGGHPTTSNLCEDCHSTNTWDDATFNHDNVSGVCGSCHAADFKPGPHKKTEKPSTIFYTVNELTDCTDSCHMYKDNTFTTIEKRRNGPEHNPDRGEW